MTSSQDQNNKKDGGGGVDDSEHSISMDLLMESSSPTNSPTSSPKQASKPKLLPTTPPRERERERDNRKQMKAKSMSPAPVSIRRTLSSQRTPKSKKTPLRLPSKSDRRGKMRMAGDFRSDRSMTGEKLKDDFKNLLDESLTGGKSERGESDRRKGMGDDSEALAVPMTSLDRNYSTSTLKKVEVVQRGMDGSSQHTTPSSAGASATTPIPRKNRSGKRSELKRIKTMPEGEAEKVASDVKAKAIRNNFSRKVKKTIRRASSLTSPLRPNIDLSDDEKKKKDMKVRKVRSSSEVKPRSVSPMRHKSNQSTPEVSPKSSSRSTYKMIGSFLSSPMGSPSSKEKAKAILSPKSKKKAYKKLGTKFSEKFSKSMTSFHTTNKSAMIMRDMGDLSLPEDVPDPKHKESAYRRSLRRSDDDDDVDDLPKKKKSSKGKDKQDKKSELHRAASSPTTLRRMSSSFSKFEELKSNLADKHTKARAELKAKKAAKKKAKSSDKPMAVPSSSEGTEQQQQEQQDESGAPAPARKKEKKVKARRVKTTKTKSSKRDVTNKERKESPIRRMETNPDDLLPTTEAISKKKESRRNQLRRASSDLAMYLRNSSRDLAEKVRKSVKKSKKSKKDKKDKEASVASSKELGSKDLGSSRELPDDISAVTPKRKSKHKSSKTKEGDSSELPPLTSAPAEDNNKNGSDFLSMENANDDPKTTKPKSASVKRVEKPIAAAAADSPGGVKSAAQQYALAFKRRGPAINFDAAFKQKSEDLIKVILSAQSLPPSAEGNDNNNKNTQQQQEEQAEQDEEEDPTDFMSQAMRMASPTPFLCPISENIMKDPVTTSVGSTYERKAIQWWLSKSDIDPVTQLAIPDKVLKPNKELRETIEDWKEDFRSQMSPAMEVENSVPAEKTDGVMKEPEKAVVLTPTTAQTKPQSADSKEKDAEGDVVMAPAVQSKAAADSKDSPDSKETENTPVSPQQVSDIISTEAKEMLPEKNSGGNDLPPMNSETPDPIESVKENEPATIDTAVVELSTDVDVPTVEELDLDLQMQDWKPDAASLPTPTDMDEPEEPAELDAPMDEGAIDAILENLRRASTLGAEAANLVEPEAMDENAGEDIASSSLLGGDKPEGEKALDASSASLPGYDWTAAKTSTSALGEPAVVEPEPMEQDETPAYDWKAQSPKRKSKEKVSTAGLAGMGFWSDLTSGKSEEPAAESTKRDSRSKRDSGSSSKSKSKPAVTIKEAKSSEKKKSKDNINMKKMSQSTSALMDILHWQDVSESEEVASVSESSSSSEEESSVEPTPQRQSHQPKMRRKSMFDSDSEESDNDESEDSTERKETSMSLLILEGQKDAKKLEAPADDSLTSSRGGASLGLDDLGTPSGSLGSLISSSDEESEQEVKRYGSLPDIDASGDHMGNLPTFTTKPRQRPKLTSSHVSMSALDYVQFTPRNFVQQREERFDDYYTLGQLLGEGEFGEVFIGYQKQGSGLGEERAIKIIDKHRMCAGDYEQVINEFNLLKGLTHPNLLTLYGFYEDDSNCYIVTDLCKGGELWDELDVRGNFEEADAAVFITNLLSAVKFLQSHKIVHRDINLENILLEENKELDHMKIIDFGLATKYEDGVKLTELVGKVHYVAPEVLNQWYEGSKYDVWSCGVVAFILLSGYAPFEGDNDALVMEQVTLGLGDANFNDPAWDDISDEAKDFVRHLLTYEEDSRPTAEQALKHAWIQNSIKANDESFMQTYGESSITCFENMQDFASDVSLLKLKQAVYIFIASQLLLKEEREEIDRVFRGMDNDCDGKLSKPDIKIGYKRFFNKELSDKETDKMFDRINTSKTGFIDYTEFVIAAMQKSKILDSDKLRAAFSSFDRGDKGFISANDLKLALTGVIALPVDNKDGLDADGIIHEMINQVDVEGDGKISYQNFEDMMMAEGVAADADDDAMEVEEPIDDALAPPEMLRQSSLDYNFASASFIGRDSNFNAKQGNAFMTQVGPIMEE